MAASISAGVRNGRIIAPLAGEQLGQRQVLGRRDLDVARRVGHQPHRSRRCARPARRRRSRRAVAARRGIRPLQHRARKPLRRLGPPESVARDRAARSRVASSAAASLSVSLTRHRGDGAFPGPRVRDDRVDDRRARRTAARHRAPAPRCTPGRAPRARRATESRALGAARRRPPSRPPATPRRNAGGAAASAGGRTSATCATSGMRGERPQRAQHHRHAGDRLILLGRLAAETGAPPRGDDDHADVTRQAPAPAARRGRARPSRRPATCAAAARRAEHPAEAEPRRLGDAALDARRSDGSRRPGRSRRGR